MVKKKFFISSLFLIICLGFFCFASYFSNDWINEGIKKDFTFFLSNSLEYTKPSEIIEDARAKMKEDPYFDPLYLHIIRKNGVYFFEPITLMKDHPRIGSVIESFKKLENLYNLPDFDVVVSLHDSHSDDKSKKGPILTFSKLKSQQNTIMIPDFEALAVNKGLYKSVIKGKELYPWQNKIEKGFWRGSRTGSGSFLDLARTQCVKLSFKQPDLLDARFTDFNSLDTICNQFSDFFSNSASITDHIKYKYQINIDGNASTYSRLFWQLFSGCVVFNQESNFTQWYHFALKPYYHFIPIKNDISDLAEKILWAKDNPEKVKKIAKNSERFAESHLETKKIYDYLYKVICACASLNEQNK